MTETLKEMVKQKKGYRTESYSGSGVRNIFDVIRFEISLGNTDIIDYLQKKYEILSEYVLEPTQISELKEICESPEEFKSAVFDSFSEMIEENAGFVTDGIVDFLKEKLNANEDDLIGLWLTTEDNVKRIYNNNQDDDIDEYLLPKNYIVISDLDTDGSLFVFTK